MLNRAMGRARIFGKQRDFEAFEEVIRQTKQRLPMQVLAWCVMWNAICCGRRSSKRLRRGGGRAFRIASTTTKRDCWTIVPCRCRGVGDNMCNARRRKRS